MKVLVVGSGGREHALCWALAASPLCDKLYCAPGNAGIAEQAELVPIAAENIEGLVEFARSTGIDFVVVGPEAPLVAGLADHLEEAGIRTFGPSAAAAQLEGSKGFMKDLCRRVNVPTAAYGRFRDLRAAKDFVRRHNSRMVIKADGLAAGKGVIIPANQAEAFAALEDMMVQRRFGAAGDEVVVEDFLAGEEASFFALCDGRTALPLASAQDHKAVGNGDRGPNTGGMGAYSPAPIMTEAMTARVMAEIINPVVKGMADAGTPFRGVLFAGLMIDPKGPKLLEFNVRFGDPECQVLMLRLQSDLLPALVAARDGMLDHFDLRWYPDAALCVVMAANGYPGDYAKGTEIKGLDKAAQVPGVTVFHAGTRAEGDRILANGGRVLGVSARAADVRAAQVQAYAAVDRIDWPQGFCRRDIGWRAVARG
ncbi:MAG: phosphoribosylamine--glycine ligase [Alphaproteobacteria bacterium]|nr:phosphoribosylamine--glycine ligase [Alphaproteobacteria bacterium]